MLKKVLKTNDLNLLHSLLFVASGSPEQGPILSAAITEFFQAGGRLCQFRPLGWSDRETWRFLQSILPQVPEDGTLLLNERLDYFLAARQISACVGLHVKASGPPTRDLRALLGDGALLGRSTHSLPEARDAEAQGADYVVFGPVFDTPSKRPFGPPQGLRKLREVASTVTIPVLAIGGIAPSDVADVLSANATGVAALSGILSHASARQATKEYLHALQDFPEPRDEIR